MECSHRFPSFGRFEWVLGPFWPKNGCFGPKLQFLKLRSATCESRSRPPLSSFLLKLCVIVLHTHRYHPPKLHSNPKHHDGVLILAHFARAACLLLAACCLLAKPGRSTLDTKKGYKTKTGSTSSVTLTLIKTKYWDRAGGVVPMLLYVLWWRKVNWGLQPGVGGWQLRVACMWLCVLYSLPSFCIGNWLSLHRDRFIA